MNDEKHFSDEVTANINNLQKDRDLTDLSRIWVRMTSPYKYTYNFRWLGRPIIQFPQDIMAMQEIIWDVKPDLIVETGIARGGSVIFYASMLELLGGNGKVLGIDVDIREHNKQAIEEHIMSKRIRMIQGSSIDPDIAQKVKLFAKDYKKVLVILDSNHTHDHVFQELNMYSELVSKGSYLVVFDTIVEDMPSNFFPDRPWGKGNNPKTAVYEFLNNNDRFVIDRSIESKLLITVAPDGYLKCVKD
ncbi:MAG: cephalosporin hydroxylase [Methanomicrobiales archaeon]|nr:cephalosporin hydroxylase [Methanomicrobiales archaeon]